MPRVPAGAIYGRPVQLIASGLIDRPAWQGPCARCQTPMARYGPHATGTLCGFCRAELPRNTNPPKEPTT